MSRCFSIHELRHEHYTVMKTFHPPLKGDPQRNTCFVCHHPEIMGVGPEMGQKRVATRLAHPLKAIFIGHRSSMLENSR